MPAPLSQNNVTGALGVSLVLPVTCHCVVLFGQGHCFVFGKPAIFDAARGFGLRGVEDGDVDFILQGFEILFERGIVEFCAFEVDSAVDFGVVEIYMRGVVSIGGCAISEDFAAGFDNFYGVCFGGYALGYLLGFDFAFDFGLLMKRIALGFENECVVAEIEQGGEHEKDEHIA